MKAVEFLKENDALKFNLRSADGANLNDEEIDIYWQALLKILNK